MGVRVEVDDQGIPRLSFPEPFNAAEYFIDRHIAEGRGNHVAIRTLNAGNNVRRTAPYGQSGRQHTYKAGTLGAASGS